MRVALSLLAVAALTMTGCAPEPLTQRQPATAPSSSGSVVDTTKEPSAEPCLAEATDLSLARQVGQLFMVGVSEPELDEATRSAIADHHVGSVVLLSNRTAGSSAIRQLTAEIGAEGTAALPIMVAVDQEGGAVQRLQGSGFDTMPAARVQGSWEAAKLKDQATSWAQQLRKAGITYNLAPVADVVPEAKRSTNAPIGALRRDFGADPHQVATSVTAFIDGMRDGGVRATVKHFPGLGEVTANTDFDVAHDDDVTASSASLEPFRAAIAAGVDSVMVSSAVFEKIDPRNPGVFSSAVITDLLRDKLGYGGVVIADDLGSAAAVRDVAPGDRAVRFLKAGGDLVINADPGLMADMAGAVEKQAGRDAQFADQIRHSVARVLQLKTAAGLMTCGG